MDALKTAARESFDQSCADLRVVVNGLDAATLAQEPAPETNSLATLVRHATSSTRFLLSCAATGDGDRRHYMTVTRTAAFAGGENEADGLIGLIDALEEDGRRLIAELPPERLGGPAMREGTTDTQPTRAWALLRALEHLREHVGHAQLTRQVLVG
jgi:Protein of unknown function (DUF664)